MANKLMEELLDLKTQYETLHQEEIAKIIDFISKDKTTMTSTKYLIEKMENFELNFLEKPNYTPEYKKALDKIKRSVNRI